MPELGPGTRLGLYEISEQIGAGGMGEVYRATDTRLKRQVALKVLPASVTGDPDRLARFEHEAEVLASLNHPNIAALYGVEESGSTKALVMHRIVHCLQSHSTNAVVRSQALPCHWNVTCCRRSAAIPFFCVVEPVT